MKLYFYAQSKSVNNLNFHFKYKNEAILLCTLIFI